MLSYTTWLDTVKSNLKRLMGDSMEMRILKNVCDTSAMSSCQQEFVSMQWTILLLFFLCALENSCSSDLYPDMGVLSIYWCGDVMSRSCQWVYTVSLASYIILSYGGPLLKSSLLVLQCDVFLSHPQSGILMAFRILGINPIKAAISPESVYRNLPPFVNRHEDLVMSQADSNLMAKLRQVSYYLIFCRWCGSMMLSEKKSWSIVSLGNCALGWRLQVNIFVL